MNETTPDSLLKLLEQAQQSDPGLPPVHKWEPDNQQDIDMRIARDGTWYYQGDPIRREKMVRLFATIIRRDGDRYFLVTPGEKLGIQVDDAPFVATSVETVEHEGRRKLVFTTNVGDAVVAGPDHPLEVVNDAQTGEPSPYIHVRTNLWALMNRPVFYQLVNMAEEVPDDDETAMMIDSDGERFVIGRY